MRRTLELMQWTKGREQENDAARKREIEKKKQGVRKPTTNSRSFIIASELASCSTMMLMLMSSQSDGDEDKIGV